MTLLYHGTSAKHRKSILSRGIVPRGRRRDRGNWEKFPSRTDMVYLTTAYAPYFAISAIDDSSDAVFMIVEANVDDANLYPDEDFVSQTLAKQRGVPIEACHDTVRRTLLRYRHHWRDSLAGMGNAAHRGTVPPERITRLCVVDLSRQRELAMLCDPVISPLNYRICGERYRSIIAWLFGDRPDFILGHGDNDQHCGMMERIQPGYTAEVTRLFSCRDGISVDVVGGCVWGGMPLDAQ